MEAIHGRRANTDSSLVLLERHHWPYLVRIAGCPRGDGAGFTVGAGDGAAFAQLSLRRVSRGGCGHGAGGDLPGYKFPCGLRGRAAGEKPFDRRSSEAMGTHGRWRSFFAAANSQFVLRSSALGLRLGGQG